MRPNAENDAWEPGDPLHPEAPDGRRCSECGAEWTVDVDTCPECATLPLADYRCKWCGKVVKRRSNKAWVASMCDDTGYRNVHLMRVIPPAETHGQALRDASEEGA